jgi:cytochrome c-type biogenesis protein CcmE
MSKKLDDELAEAILPKDDAGRGSTPAVTKAAAASAPARRAPRSTGLLVTLLVMVGAVVALFLVGFKEAAVYATTVDKLMASKGESVGKKLRMEGELVPGTLVKRDQPCEYRFTVHGETSRVPVRYAQCVIPDTFRDVPQGGVQVTVEGALTANGEFEASLVMAKCASKYDPTKHEMKEGEAANELPVN